MLEQFTWGEFLLAIALLNLVWYGLVIIGFYRKEMLGFLVSEGGSFAFTSVPRKNDERDQAMLGTGKVEQGEGARADEVSLMGESRLPEGVEVMSSSQVAFSGRDDDSRYEQVGLVADVVQELKIIFSELENKAGNKGDFFRMLERLKEDYGQLGGHPNIGAINEFIRNADPFHLTKQEIDNLWY